MKEIDEIMEKREELDTRLCNMTEHYNNCDYMALSDTLTEVHYNSDQLRELIIALQQKLKANPTFEQVEPFMERAYKMGLGFAESDTIGIKAIRQLKQLYDSIGGAR